MAAGVKSPLPTGDDSASWRLLLDGECDPFWNMAVDSAILRAVGRGETGPTIRLYRWNRTAVSVGRFQNVERTLKLEYCERTGIPVVRRPTGGRGILHGTDQTCAIAALTVDLGPAGERISDSYRLLSLAFLEALRRLDVPAAQSRNETAVGAGDCLASCSVADVVAQAGLKLVGSAQRRCGAVLLQQSSIRHLPPNTEPGFVFEGRVASGDGPLASVPTETLQESLINGFETALGIRLKVGKMTAAEHMESEKVTLRLRQADPRLRLVDSDWGI